MSVDDRLRVALQDQADAFVPRVEESLERVRSRGRFQRWRGSVIAVASAAAVAAVIGGAVLSLDGHLDQQPPSAERPTGSLPSTVTSTPVTPLRGSITAHVDRPGSLVGRWTLRLNGNGSIGVSPPAGFGREVSGAVFTADGSSFRTSLFSDDICSGEGTGIYSWLRVGNRIDFEVLSDTCTARARYFADSTWALSTGTAVRD